MSTITTNNANAKIELKVLDTTGHERMVTISFNHQDGWNNAYNGKSLHDIISFFAGNMMQVVQQDNTVVGYEAKAYKEKNGEFVKAVNFTSYLKHEGEFKPVFVNEKGKVEFL